MCKIWKFESIFDINPIKCVTVFPIPPVFLLVVKMVIESYSNISYDCIDLNWNNCMSGFE